MIVRGAPIKNVLLITLLGITAASSFALADLSLTEARALLASRKGIRPMEFVRIKKPKVPFVMGCDPNEEGKNEYGESFCFDDEKPPHLVRIPWAFKIQTTEVTQAQWYEVMGTAPSYFKKEEFCPGNYIAELGICPNHPVESVSWLDAQEFIKNLNELKKKGSWVYRLPYEAEWEYAARAGTKTSWSCGNDPGCLEGYGIYFDFNPGRNPHRPNGNAEAADTGSLLANDFGLYDMHGNVSEWMENGYEVYPQSLVTDITQPREDSYRVIRGGSWGDDVGYVRSAKRSKLIPNDSSTAVGFRLVKMPR